jgi:hypothetical protein
MNCNSPSWYTDAMNNAFINSGETNIYVLEVFDGSWVFFKLNTLIGLTEGKTYKLASHTNWIVGYKIIQDSNNKIYMTFKWGNHYIVVYDKVLDFFTEYVQTTTGHFRLFGLAVEGSNLYSVGMSTMSGADECSITKTFTDYITGIPYYTTAAISMVQTFDYQIFSDTPTTKSISTVGLTLSSSITEDPSFTIVNNTGDSYTSDAAFFLDTFVNMTLPENYQRIISLDLVWSITGATTITYSLTQNGDYELPSWVSVNNADKQLEISAPNVDKTSQFSFAIESTVLGETAVTPSYVTVVDWKVENCHQCQTDNTKWQICEDGLTTNDESTKCISKTTGAVLAAAQGMVAASAGVGAALATSGSSFQSMFASVNQFQMFMILPLIGAEIPEDILFFLQGFSFASMNFDFIPKLILPNGLSYSEDINWEDIEDDYLSTIGTFSVWTFINYSMNIVLFMILGLIHLTLIPLYLWAKKYENWISKLLK